MFATKIRAKMSELDKLQKRLDEKGVRNIKVFWGDLYNISIEEIEKQLINILNSHLDGGSTVLGLIGDSTVDRLLTHKESV